MSEKTITVQANLSKALHVWVRLYAKSHGLSMGEAVKKIILEKYTRAQAGTGPARGWIITKGENDERE